MPFGRDANLTGAQHRNDAVDAGDRLGLKVSKTANIPASATSITQMFNVTGKVLVTLLIGEVTSVLATVTSMAIRSSTGSKAIAAVTDVLNDALGTLYVVTGDPDDGLNGDATGAGQNADIATLKTAGAPTPFIVNDDAIENVITTNGTGTILWELWYIPLESGATVAAA